MKDNYVELFILNINNLNELISNVVNEPFAELSPKKVTAEDAEVMIKKL